jgi:hypothetical protein
MNGVFEETEGALEETEGTTAAVRYAMQSECRGLQETAYGREKLLEKAMITPLG